MPVTIKSYYQTTPMTEEQLQDAVRSCKNQEKKVYEIFKKFGTMTSWDVYDVYNILIEPVHITSIRRAMDTLKKNNIIQQIGSVPGDEGRPLFLFKLMNDNVDVIERKLDPSIPKYVKLEMELKQDGSIDRDKLIEQLYQKINVLRETFNI